MQALNGETKRLGGIVEKGRPSWEKGVVRDLTTRQHVVAATERETCTCGCVGYLMLEIFPLVGRLSQADSKDGVVGQKSSWKIFRTVEVI